MAKLYSNRYGSSKIKKRRLKVMHKETTGGRKSKGGMA